MGKCTRGTWTCHEIMWHINELELLAVKFAFQTFSKGQYLKRMRCIRNQKMTKIANNIWGVLLSNGITTTVEHFPSALSRLADQESRRRTKNSEWILCKDVFQSLCLKLGISEIDIFASRMSH